MKKIWKIGLSLGIITLGAAVVIPPIVTCEVSNSHKNSFSTNSLLNGDNSQNEIINNLSSNWINNNKNTEFIETLFSQITSFKRSNNKTLLLNITSNENSSNSPNSKSNYSDLSLIRTLPALYQSKIKNAMLDSYLKIKSYLNATKENIKINDYLGILSPYVSKQTINKIKEGLNAKKNNNNLAASHYIFNHNTNLFFIPEVSFIQNSTTVQQLINELKSIKTDANYAAIAASALAVLAGIGGIFFPPLEIVATVAGLAAFTCSTISFGVGCAIDNMEERIGENPNLTSTIVSSTSLGAKFGLTATKTIAQLNQNLGDLEGWLDDVPYLGNLISLIFEVVNALGSN